jgi:hypothetical protein
LGKKMYLRRSLCVAAMMALGTFISGSASASTVRLGENIALTATINVDCPFGCSGYTGDTSLTFGLNGLTADAYNFGSADEAAIAEQFSLLSGLTGSSALVASDVMKIDVPNGVNGENFSFDIVAGNFFVKYGEYTSFLFADAAQTVTFTKTGRGPAGLSNYGTTSVPTPVPVPASGLLLLFAFGGMVALRRALLRKSADERSSPFPRQIYPTAFVTGMPRAV